jgi:hypothetical protein
MVSIQDVAELLWSHDALCRAAIFAPRIQKLTLLAAVE